MPKVMYKYGIFMFVPGIVLGCSVLLKIAAGPYWLDQNMEGPYASLVNALDMLKGDGPDDTSHPGTPTQILCFVICWLFNMGRSAGDAVTHVLMAPEFYLHVAFVTLSLFSFITSFALAVYVFRETKDKLAALLTQLPALSFLVLKIYSTQDPIIPVVANVSSEPLLISIVNLFNLCFLKVFFSKTAKDTFVPTLFWGFLCGWGVAEKFDFIPLLMIPLIILSWKNRVFFICALMASFFAWTLPILSKYPALWDMFKYYLFPVNGEESGKLGTKDILTYGMNFKNIIVDYWVFAGIAFAALFFTLWKIKENRWGKGSLFLLVISLGVLFEFSIVAKHPSSQYLMPGLGLFSSLLVLFYLQGPGRRNLGRRMAFIFILAFILIGTWQAMVFRYNLAGLSKDTLGFYEHVHAEYQNCIFIHYYRSTGQDYALFWADEWKGSPHLRKEMYQVYPKSLFLIEEGWGNNIVSFKDRVLSNDLLAHSSCVLFQGDRLYGDLDVPLKGSALSVQLLEKGRVENIYRLTGTTEKQAIMYFIAADHFFQTGDYPKALECAYLAKANHFQRERDIDTFIQYVIPYVRK